MCIYGYVNNLEFHESFRVNLQFHEFFFTVTVWDSSKVNQQVKRFVYLFLIVLCLFYIYSGLKNVKKGNLEKPKFTIFFLIPYCNIYCLHFDPQNIFSICITYIAFSVGCCVALEKLAGKLSFTSVMCPWDVKNYLKKFCFC